jgi:DNA processing protein
MDGQIKSVNIRDENYPKLLKEIKDPPEILYYRGEILSNENCFAIVGTRRCSNYGKEIAWQIASDLAEAGLTIVSGFAPGIDTIAHRAAIEKGGRTIAVLGTGIDEKSIYPKSNLKLVDKILENGGAIISEFEPGTHGTKYTFPQRNRIISGLSLGVLVVEARIQSGSLITASYAIEQKRKVFAVPGSIFSQTSKGCHFLIKNGAKLVESAEDILEELGIRKKEVGRREIKGKTPEENLILEVLKEGALDVEKIIEKTKLPPSKVASILSILEIEGKIKNLGGNTFCLAKGNSKF